MLRVDPVIAIYVSEDFYFFFEEESISKLNRERLIKSQCWYSASFDSYDVFHLDLVVQVFRPSLNIRDTDVLVDFAENKIDFYISERDFDEWLLRPSNWMLENGPNLRSSLGANVYLRKASAQSAESFKTDLINFIANAEVIQA